MDSYFKQNPPDCSLISEDNFEFPVHKEVLYQTSFLRTVLKSVDDDSYKIKIICSFLEKEKLGIIVEFLYSGKISCSDLNVASNACKFLTQLFGFPPIDG